MSRNVFPTPCVYTKGGSAANPTHAQKGQLRNPPKRAAYFLPDVRALVLEFLGRRQAQEFNFVINPQAYDKQAGLVMFKKGKRWYKHWTCTVCALRPHLWEAPEGYGQREYLEYYKDAGFAFAWKCSQECMVYQQAGLQTYREVQAERRNRRARQHG